MNLVLDRMPRGQWQVGLAEGPDGHLFPFGEEPWQIIWCDVSKAMAKNALGFSTDGVGTVSQPLVSSKQNSSNSQGPNSDRTEGAAPSVPFRAIDRNVFILCLSLLILFLFFVFFLLFTQGFLKVWRARTRRSSSGRF